MGFGQIKDIVVNLLAQINNAYLVVICGSNEKSKEELEKIDNVNLIVKGFANNKMSIRANNINEIVDATKKLLSDKMLREELMINQRKLINKYSAKSLVEYVLKYMNDEEVL